MDTPPLVIVGAGPIGLTAAAHARSRGLRTLVLEAGPTAAAAVRQWGHVRLFSAWSELVDPVARDLLSASEGGWTAPDPTTYPTGEEWASRYLLPLAEALDATDEVEVRTGCRVVGVTRQGRDRLVDSGRSDTPFELRVATGERWERVPASAVVDASGTWGHPSPLGSDGLPAYGEAEHADRITYGIPDLSAPDVAERYARRHVAVAGSGASAQNVLVALTGLAPRGTTVSWLVRRGETADAFGGGDNDQLEARGALGKAAEAAVRTGPVRAVTRFRAAGIGDDPARPGALRITSTDGATVDGVDEVVVVTGFRPDLDWLGEVRLELDPVLSAPTRLAPLIDPNVHSCGTVYPHGAAELAQPEPGLYLAGMKSYGRAPSFLALTGFEQVRSIVAALAGDHEAAARVELVLPETGVCGGSGQFDTPAEDAGCCAAPAGDLLTIGPPAG
ncbi:NAD(P)-binding domain-containing protein [Nocardioides lijunqiniae]|uniref:NAD(P)-binding domain-containing protein n=1 Tax=Nocardioides lijunqiniae TaxID=2760832 RepID=UPI0018784263|nr:NAD(P)-binding domain-containing protein [Nocardioides lijunqiniae]